MQVPSEVSGSESYQHPPPPPPNSGDLVLKGKEQITATTNEDEAEEASIPVLSWVLGAGAVLVAIVVAVALFRRIRQKRRGDTSHLPKEVKMTFS